MDPIIAWALAIMLAWAPPGRSRIKEAVETPEAGAARYAEIAREAAQVVFDPAERPMVAGPRARSQSLALLLSVALHESGFRRDVDLGLGPLARGSGTDSCLMQIRVGKGQTPEGWAHADLVADRKKCFRAGLRLLRRSIGACRSLPPLDWLSAYARGQCTRDEPVSHALISPAFGVRSAPFDDAEVARRLAMAAPPQPAAPPPDLPPP
jgi:hypothetical protein